MYGDVDGSPSGELLRRRQSHIPLPCGAALLLLLLGIGHETYIGLCLHINFIFKFVECCKNVADEDTNYKIPSFGTEWLLKPCCYSSILRPLL